MKILRYIMPILLFCSCESLIEEPKSKHYYYNWDKSKIIYNDHRTWRNKTEVDVDIATFEVIKGRWAKDKNSIIYDGKKRPNIDVASFYIDDNDVPKDKYHVFTTNWAGYTDNMLVWNGADPKTFVHIRLAQSSNKEMWGKDNAHYFRKLHQVAGDYNTYEVLSEQFSKDKNKVYYEGAIIEGADPKTFHYDTLNNTYRDAAHEYSFQGVRK